MQFTDEAHYDGSSVFNGRILREKGSRYDSENTKKKVKLKGMYL